MPCRYRPREVIRVLLRLGWERVGQEGSHVKLTLPDGSRTVSVPEHRGEVRPGTFSSILRQADMTAREFHSWAEEILSKWSRKKVTVVLFHDDESGGYVAVMPTFPHCTTQGDSVGHALAMAKECLELNLQEPTDWDLFNLDNAYSEHVVVGTVEVDVPLLPEPAKHEEDSALLDAAVAVTTED